MRRIKSIIWHQEKVSAKDQIYQLYCYQLDDGEEVESTEEFKVGEEVTTWFDDQWNKSKLRRKRGGKDDKSK